MSCRVVFTGRAFYFFLWLDFQPSSHYRSNENNLCVFVLPARHGILCLSVPPAARRHLKREQTSLSEKEATPSSACFAEGKIKNKGRDGGGGHCRKAGFFFNGVNLVAGRVPPQTVDN